MLPVKPEWFIYIAEHDEIEVLRIIPGLSVLFFSVDWAFNFLEKLLPGNIYSRLGRPETTRRPLILSPENCGLLSVYMILFPYKLLYNVVCFGHPVLTTV